MVDRDAAISEDTFARLCENMKPLISGCGDNIGTVGRDLDVKKGMADAHS
jgi:hypothetical protein